MTPITTFKDPEPISAYEAQATSDLLDHLGLVLDDFPYLAHLHTPEEKASRLYSHLINGMLFPLVLISRGRITYNYSSTMPIAYGEDSPDTGSAHFTFTTDFDIFEEES